MNTEKITLAILLAFLLVCWYVLDTRPAEGATVHSVTCTAYSIGDNHTPKTGLTASGTRPRHDWTIAISRDLEKHFPMGSIVYVEGVGRCRIEDRMHRRMRNRIDVYKRTPRLAKQWGIRKVTLKKGHDMETRLNCKRCGTKPEYFTNNIGKHILRCPKCITKHEVHKHIRKERGLETETYERTTYNNKTEASSKNSCRIRWDKAGEAIKTAKVRKTK